MTEPFQRSLDLADTSSIDVVALNNKVVSMRAVVKRAKLYVINNITKKVKKLKNKKGTEEQKKQNQDKADRLLEEVKVLKVLSPDYVSKFALGNTDKFTAIICRPTTSIETRAMTRLSEQKFIHDVVTEFRAKHDDWKDLAAYLMTKHTSREFKKKKTKPKMEKVATNMKTSETLVQKYLGDKLGKSVDELDESESDNDSVCSLEKMATNVKASEAMVKTYLGVKEGKTDNKTSENDSDAEDWESVGSDEEDDDEEAYHELCRKTGDEKTVAKGEISDEDSMDDSGEDSDGEQLEGSDDNESDVDDEVGDDDDDDSEDDDLSQENISNSAKKDQKSEKDTKGKLTKTNNSNASKQGVVQSKGKSNTQVQQDLREALEPPVTEKVKGEMIIKPLNLNEMNESDELPAFLTQDVKTSEKSKKAKADAFFATEDSDDGGDDEDGEGEAETFDENKEGSDVDEDTWNEIEGRYNTDSTKADIHRGMKAFSTTFVGSLKSKEMMKCKGAEFRTNQDWKKMRQEQWTGQSRGRGGGFSRGGRGDGRGRGRGDSRGRGRGDSRGRGRGDFNQRGRGGSDSRGRGSFRGQSRGDFRGQSRGDFRGRGRGSSRDQDWTNRKPTNEHRENKLGTGQQSDRKPEKLHPSWEASKKRKEQAASIQPFAGKKIKFDD